MAQTRIYWERSNYPQVEKLFRKSVEFCSENDAWKLNVAHVLFMQVRTCTCTCTHIHTYMYCCIAV